FPAERAEQLIGALWRTAGTRDRPSDRDGCVRTTAEKLANGEHVQGWPTLAELLGDNGNTIVRRVREWLGIAGNATSEIPLPIEPPWPSPLAEEAFYGLAGDAVRVLGPSSEADPAALLFQVLVAFGNVIGRAPHFVVEADKHFTNEYLVL